jgi:hypothetical protein
MSVSILTSLTYEPLVIAHPIISYPIFRHVNATWRPKTHRLYAVWFQQVSFKRKSTGIDLFLFRIKSTGGEYIRF